MEDDNNAPILSMETHEITPPVQAGNCSLSIPVEAADDCMPSILQVDEVHSSIQSKEDGELHSSIHGKEGGELHSSIQIEEDGELHSSIQRKEDGELHSNIQSKEDGEFLKKADFFAQGQEDATGTINECTSFAGSPAEKVLMQDDFRDASREAVNFLKESEQNGENKSDGNIIMPLQVLAPLDAVMTDGGTEDLKEVSEWRGTIVNFPLDEKVNSTTQSSDKQNEELILLSNADERDAVHQTRVVHNVSCKTVKSIVPIQEDVPCYKGFGIDDTFGEVKESQDMNRRSSLKRSLSSCCDNIPSVQVTYECLTSESKNKLKELLRHWAEWHGKNVGVKEVAEKQSLESGEETYFPALQVGGPSKATMSFWMDKPSKHARTENTTSELTPASQEREREVPLYDRVGTGALISQETEMPLDRGLEYMDEDSRCFNCGSYSHSLKECPRPRDNAAVNSARKLMAEKRGSVNGSRVASRYYQSTPGGKFDDLKPGFLGSETRQLLGIGEKDPPPWLNRMRELGYPPGYLEDQEEEQSGIAIFGTSEDAEGSFFGEDGEIVGEGQKKLLPGKKMTVHFPGVNAPIPEDADHHTWGLGLPADFGGKDHRTGRHGHTSHFSAAAVTSGSTVYTDMEGPPGTGRDSYHLSSSKARGPGFETPMQSWQSNEQTARVGSFPLARSPQLGRSASDSGRRSPKVAYDEPHSLPPLGGLYASSRHSPLHTLRPHHHQSPSIPHQRSPYGHHDSRDSGLDPRRRAWEKAHEALQSMHRSERRSPPRRSPPRRSPPSSRRR